MPCERRVAVLRLLQVPIQHAQHGLDLSLDELYLDVRVDHRLDVFARKACLNIMHKVRHVGDLVAISGQYRLQCVQRVVYESHCGPAGVATADEGPMRVEAFAHLAVDVIGGRVAL